MYFPHSSVETPVIERLAHRNKSSQLEPPTLPEAEQAGTTLLNITPCLTNFMSPSSQCTGLLLKPWECRKVLLNFTLRSFLSMGGLTDHRRTLPAACEASHWLSLPSPELPAYLVELSSLAAGKGGYFTFLSWGPFLHLPQVHLLSRSKIWFIPITPSWTCHLSILDFLYVIHLPNPFLDFHFTVNLFLY